MRSYPLGRIVSRPKQGLVRSQDYTTDPIITRNATNVLGPGHSVGASALAVSTGVAINKCVTFTNRSRAAITKASLCFAGFHLKNPTAGSTPWVPVGNDTPLTASIAYPAGDQYAASGTPSTTVVTSDSVKANSYYNSGTLYWLSGTLAGTSVAPGNFTYALASGTFTFSPALASAPASGDKFMVFTSATQFTSMNKSASPSLVVTNSATMRTDGDTLATPIAIGDTFTVVMVATPANGLNYITSSLTTPLHPGLGLFGVCTTAAQSTLCKVMTLGIGDSIATNNGAVFHAVSAYLNAPSMHLSISGFRAKHYGQTAGIYFQNIVDMAVLLGATEVNSNLGTNDIGVDLDATVTLGWSTTMKTMLAAQSITFAPATITPQTTYVTVTASLMVSVSTTMTATVPDASKFIVGRTYLVLGADQAEYNGVKFCLARNTGANTVDFLFVGSATPTATGTITLDGGLSSATLKAHSAREFQAPAVNMEAGGSSIRGLLNAAIRNASNFLRYIEFGDACELVRDDGIWAVGGDKTELDAPFGLITVSTVISGLTRFTSTGYTGNNAAAGCVQCVSATNTGNIGLTRNVSSSNGTDITVAAFPSNIVIGDTFYITTGSLIACNQPDGLHPQAAVGAIGAASYRGGQALLTNAYITYLTARLA